MTRKVGYERASRLKANHHTGRRAAALDEPSRIGHVAKTIDQLLDDARRCLDRVGPQQAHAAMRWGALLVDIRSELERERDGVIPGSTFIARNVLEWRCDPRSRWRDREVTERAGRVILICDEGYQSSLAAATLQQLGLRDATDVIGGFQAWRAAGLPVTPQPVRRNSSANVSRKSAPGSSL
jgi:rhodanese-related sulfurtransferase